MTMASRRYPATAASYSGRASSGAGEMFRRWPVEWYTSSSTEQAISSNRGQRCRTSTGSTKIMAHLRGEPVADRGAARARS
jgi:hypothetical protein